MKKTILFMGMASILILSGCAQKVTSNMTKTYSPLPADSPIEVYAVQDAILDQAELLGEVVIKDRGTSVKCDSLSVINRIKEEARKAGGNAIVVLKHIKPSFWGSSCHHMEAVVLNVPDFADMASAEEAGIQETSAIPINERIQTMVEKSEKEEAKRHLPRFSISAGGGYGWRTAKLSDGISGDQKAYLDKLRNGPVWNLSANYFFRNNYGVGITYAAYAASTSAWGVISGTEQEGNLKTKDMITYVGPSFLMRFSQNQKWIFNINFGIGYIGYSSKISFLSEESKISGSSVGFLTEIGAEYKFAKNWGIGVDFSTIGGTLSSFDLEENGVKQNIKLSGDEKEGLGHIRLGLGIKYYFK